MDWWKEGHIQGVTGWAIGSRAGESQAVEARSEAEQLYDQLHYEILPLFYDARGERITIMRQCIALNASFFNTHRMVRQYLLHA